jgi:hypothetical protein
VLKSNTYAEKVLKRLWEIEQEKQDLDPNDPKDKQKLQQLDQEQYDLVFGYGKKMDAELNSIVLTSIGLARNIFGAKQWWRVIKVFLHLNGKQPTPPTRDTSLSDSSGVTSQDPNSLVGPAGYGTANFVSDTSPLPYEINFENDPTATAPAQRVDITDQLSPDLDWSTFQLTAVGFGSTYIAIPAGLQNYDTTVNVTENGQTFEVVITLTLNPATGVFTASLQSIDPSTNLPPTDLLTGFLPPENGTGQGTGFVSFTISPSAGLPTGTQITSVALISFDGAPTIATDQVNDQDPTQGISTAKQALVTIDSVPPTSTVNPLPATVTPEFTVSWSGQDDAGGSGIAGFDIYVSDDGGPYTLADRQRIVPPG